MHPPLGQPVDEQIQELQPTPTTATAQTARATQRRGRRVKYPKAVAHALKLLAEDPEAKSVKVFNECRNLFGKEESLPRCADSFMRTVRRNRTANG
jgi:hypothetical protein